VWNGSWRRQGGRWRCDATARHRIQTPPPRFPVIRYQSQ
jgi:hypothetical protein